MYNAFFGLAEDPFSTVCDPTRFFNSKQHYGSLKGLQYGIAARMGLMSLTGEEGSGKTTVLECLRDSLEVNGIESVFLRDPRITVNRFLETIAADLLPSRRGASAYQIFAALHQHMKQQAADGRTIALLIDEAQDLNTDVFKEILHLANLEDRRGKLLQIVFAGPPELDTNLSAWNLERLNQRNLVGCRLQPFTPQETREYIDFRLECAGLPRQTLFPADVVEEIHAATRGNPRAINVLCERLLLAAFSVQVKAFTDEVLDQILGKRHRRGPRTKARIVLAGIEILQPETVGPDARAINRPALLLPASSSTSPQMIGRLPIPLSARSMSWVRNASVELRPFPIYLTYPESKAKRVAPEPTITGRLAVPLGMRSIPSVKNAFTAQWPFPAFVAYPGSKTKTNQVDTDPAADAPLRWILKENAPARMGFLPIPLGTKSMPRMRNLLVEPQPCAVCLTHPISRKSGVVLEPAARVLLPLRTADNSQFNAIDILPSAVRFPVNSASSVKSTRRTMKSAKKPVGIGARQLNAAALKQTLLPRTMLSQAMPAPRCLVAHGRLALELNSCRPPVHAPLSANGFLNSALPTAAFGTARVGLKLSQTGPQPAARVAMNPGSPRTSPFVVREDVASSAGLSTFPVVSRPASAGTPLPARLAPPVNHTEPTKFTAPLASPHNATGVNFPPLVLQHPSRHSQTLATPRIKSWPVAIGLPLATAPAPQRARGANIADPSSTIPPPVRPKVALQPVREIRLGSLPLADMSVAAATVNEAFDYRRIRVPLRAAGLAMMMGLLLFVLLPKAGTAALRAGNQVRHAMVERAAVALDERFRSGFGDWVGRNSKSTAAWPVDAAGFAHPGPLELYRPSMPLADYRMQFIGTIQKKSLSWVVRAADFDNYYVVRLSVTKPGPLPTVALTRYAVVNGKSQNRVVAPLPMIVHADTLYRVQLDVSGDNFSLKVQDQRVDTWTEPRLRHGAIGFFSDRDAQSSIAGIQVREQYDMLGRLCAFLAPPTN